MITIYQQTHPASVPIRILIKNISMEFTTLRSIYESLVYSFSKQSSESSQITTTFFFQKNEEKQENLEKRVEISLLKHVKNAITRSKMNESN